MIDPTFIKTVKQTTVADLKRKYPREARSHAAMLARHRNGRDQVSANLRPFRNFLIAMGPQPGPRYTVDRIDPHDPEYDFGKIRWASKREQSNNRKCTTLLRGEGDLVLPLSDWAKRTGQRPNTLRQRKARGWTDIEIITGCKLEKHAILSKSEVKGKSWPAGANISDWERHYRGWRIARVNPQPEDTRAVFYAWVEMSALRMLEMQLATIFPDSFGPEACPDGDDDPEIDRHPVYHEYRQRLNRLQPVLDALTFPERTNLTLLRRMRPINPSQAVEIEKRKRLRR